MMRDDDNATVRDLVEVELDRHHASATIGDTGGAWWSLERAHILSQADLPLHLRVHWTMLGYAIRLCEVHEILGQLTRLALAPLGTLTGRTPVGNTGRSNVSAFEPMAMPADLRSAIETRGER